MHHNKHKQHSDQPTDAYHVPETEATLDRVNTVQCRRVRHEPALVGVHCFRAEQVAVHLVVVSLLAVSATYSDVTSNSVPVMLC